MDKIEILNIEEFLELLRYNVGDIDDVSDIDFNDEIASIEKIGDIQTVDIEVENDHLFYANGILTHNSAYGNKEAGLESVADSLGIAQTADVFFSIIRSKEMDELNQVLVTIQKNRNTGNMSSMIMGIDYPHMRYSDINSVSSVQESNFNFNAGGLDEPW